MKEKIRQLLTNVVPAGESNDIVTLGCLSSIREIGEGTWSIVLEIPYVKTKDYLVLKDIIEKKVKKELPISQIHVAITASNDRANLDNKKSQQNSAGIKNVKHIIAVASGKGGVGKSTFTTNLALSLAQKKLRVGIVDADIYGPSQVRMMGVSGNPDSDDGKTIIPKQNYGVKMISIGLMISEKTPMIWRGPMVQKALRNLLEQTRWGELDVLLADMPPGTGDIALSMSQEVPLSGAIVISTPQDIALIDARKAIAMFERVGVKILGIVENMSVFVCPSCGSKADIFGSGGVVAEAQSSKIPMLGSIPIDIRLRQGSDNGRPLLAQNNDLKDDVCAVFHSVSDKLITILKL